MTAPPPTVLDIARTYVARGWRVVPIPSRSKFPDLKGWERLNLSLDALPRHFCSNGTTPNVGVILGDVSSGLVDVDLDDPYAVALGARWLPETDAVFGRAGKPRSHHLYRVTDLTPPRILTFEHPPVTVGERGAMIIELRGSAHQTVFPGSVHPSGERIEWAADGDPAPISAAMLTPVVERIAAGALLASCWKPGVRNSLALAVAGVLLRAGWSAEQTHDFIVAVAHVAGDDDTRASRQRVDHTAEALEAGSNVTGLPTLAGIIGDAAVKKLVTWLHLSLAARESAPRLSSDGLTDLGNSERFVAQHGHRLRYCHPWRKWLVYEGGRWRDNRPETVVALAKETVRGIYREVADETDDRKRKDTATWAKASESHSRIAAMITLAQSALPISPDDLDRDPWLLNCGNGTIDMRTGLLRPHDPADLMTKQTPVAYHPGAPCPTWDAFLHSVLGGNQAMVGFLQRVAGYSAVGSVREQCLFFLHGHGSNGKSTFLLTLQEALGAYGMQARSELLLAKRDGDHPTEVADLFGKRLVVTTEIEDGRRFAEAFLKQLTGGDRIRARRMREDPWEFDPTHKILLAANHRPDIRGTDEGIWRRIHLIPFEVTFPEDKRDRDLPEKVRAELPGILAWVVAGCLDWQRGGLQVPEPVRAATAAYRSDMDAVARYVADCCETHPTFTEKASALYRAYSSWCDANGEKTTLSQRRFGESLAERGFEKARAARGAHVWRGLRLLHAPDDNGLFDDDGTPNEDPPATPTPPPSSPPNDTNEVDTAAVGVPNGQNGGEGDPLVTGVTLGDPLSGINGLYISHEGFIRKQGSPRVTPVTLGSTTQMTAGGASASRQPAPLPCRGGCGTLTPDGWECRNCRNRTTPRPAPRYGRTPVEAPVELPVEVSTTAGARRSTPATVSVGASYPDVPLHQLTTTAAVHEALQALLAAPRIGVDTETTGLDPLSDRLRLLQLATPQAVYVLDAFHLDPRALAPLFDDAMTGPTLVGHNLKFDLRFLQRAGLAIPAGARLFDTMLASQLLSAGTRVPHNLAAVAQRALDITLAKEEQRSDWTGALSQDQLCYAALDAAVLLPLADRLRADLEGADLQRVATIEMGALPTIVWLEQTGVPFDKDAWLRLAEAAVAERDAVERDLTALAGTAGLFEGSSTTTWSSPAQVATVLRARGHDVTSVDEAALHQLVDAGEPLAPLLLRYRDAAKRASTYGAAYVAHVHPVTGRIHAGLLQLGSDAGRMSCIKPNLQQVPRQPAYRACIRPEAGRVLVKADYAQIEMRLAAEIAGDTRLIEAFQRGDDLHTVTARTVLGKTDVSKADRQAAKAVNFGLLYGMGAEGLRAYAAQNYGVQWSLQEATTVRARYFAAYRGLHAWHRGQPHTAVDTRTVAGRRRQGITSFTQKLNSPVQGSGADGLKAALGLLWETQRRAPTAAPILVVHDEIVVECDQGAAEEARAWLVDAMTRGMETVLHQAPAEVEATICANWSGEALQ